MTPQTAKWSLGSGRPPVVLVVEDEPQVREMIVEELNDLGFQVLEAESGEAGLDILRGHQPSTFCSPISACGGT